MKKISLTSLRAKRSNLPGDCFVAALLAMTLATTGCQKYYYNPAPQILPPHIQRIHIRPVINQTHQFGLEDKLTLAIQEEFLRDGRYQITTAENADGEVVTAITRYILEPLAYDASHVPIQHKLWVLLDIYMVDKVNKVTLWKESNLQGELRFFAESSGFPGALSEEEARQQIWDTLARDIRKRTLEGFGSVTGASQRAVPGKPLPVDTTAPVTPSGNVTPPPQPPPSQPSIPY